MNKKILSIILSAAMTVCASAAAVSAEDAPDEYAKGIKFTAESGYLANNYVGYVGGVAPGATAGDLLGALVNSKGIEIVRESALGNDDAVQHGDKLVLKNEAGEVKEELSIIFMGNANGDNKVNLGDVTAAIQKTANWDVDVDTAATDVNGNGVLNLSDVTLMLQKLAKWDVEFVQVPVRSAAVSVRVSKAITTCDFETKGTNPDGGGDMPNVNLKDGQELGIKFSVGEGEYAMSIKATYPSWADDRGRVSLSILKWTGDYESTVAGMPLKTVTLEDQKDGLEYEFDLTDTAGNGLAEGEYLWLLHDGFEEKVEGAPGCGIGLWAKGVPQADTGVEVYYYGEAATFGPEAYINIAAEK